MTHFDPPYVGRISWFHLSVVAVSVALTIAAWQFSSRQIDNRIGLRFEVSRDRVLALIQERMTKYEDALWAGVAAVESHGGDISYDTWHDFARTLQIEQRYPGINGIGIIHFETPQTLETYLDWQMQDRPDYRIFPEHDQPYFMPITYIEPENVNAAAIGLDVAHETNRRTAALLSRDSGLAQITGPITLVQDALSTPGFLFYAPFYSGGAQPDTEARQEAFKGAVYAPFVVQKLMDGLLAKGLRDLRISIQDGTEIIYDEHGAKDSQADPDPMISERVVMHVYGREWTLDIRSDLAFRHDNEQSVPEVILVAGLIIEALIVMMLIMMARSNRQAVAYADKVTVQLREKSAKLAQSNADLSEKNDQLEEYAYVASHDLKTPILGIGGLTEILCEDLEGYFNSPDANPEVRENLHRIQERVQRMHQLTRGILKFAQTMNAVEEDEPVDLRSYISALRFDFGLTHDELTLTGDCSVVEVDTGNFRCVLENLIGNAIKYRDVSKPLKINVQATLSGHLAHITVADNGPGIDPKFHKRIFDVFQTVPTSKTPESTGIGLAIVQKAVHRHGMGLTLDSAPGCGAIFGFHWPHGNASQPVAAPDCAA